MENETTQFEKLLRAIDIADVLNISRAKAYQLMQTGAIRTVHIGKSRRVRSQDLQDFIQENLTTTDSELMIFDSVPDF